MADLTQARLKELLNYDPETGVFTRRRGRGGQPAGGIVGCQAKHGSIIVSVDNRRYHAHRLAWLYMTGEWPSNLIDHKDRDWSDNRWGNLREADKSDNAANAKKRSDNTSGLKGVTKRRNKWIAQIRHNGQHHYLGIFATKEDAHSVYAAKAQELFGEFMRLE